MNITLTLDYELFLNDITGTVENCLIKPMKELQKICDKYKINITIFVDAAYLYKLNELRYKYPKLQKDYDKIVENIQWLVKKGLDVQLHIHPQWYYSEYNGDDWVLDWNHYKLSDMPKEYAFKMFKTSKLLLDKLVGYETSLFRAGGYSIQDFDYVSCFKDNGIIGDSSVLPGSFIRHKTHSYDYRSASYGVYKFDNNINKPVETGTFWEFPICATQAIPIWKYRNIKKKWMLQTEPNWGDGGDKPIVSKIGKIKALLSSFELFKHPHGTIDYQSYFWLKESYEYTKPYGYMTIIGHPKNFSASSLFYFDAFIKECQKNGDTFVTMHQFIKQSDK